MNIFMKCNLNEIFVSYSKIKVIDLPSKKQNKTIRQLYCVSGRNICFSLCYCFLIAENTVWFILCN